MINCPNCNKKITTIPNKELTISCTCKCTLRTNSDWLESCTRKTTFKNKTIALVYIYGNVIYRSFTGTDKEFIPKKEFVILDDNNQQMLHIDSHPTWDKLPQKEFEKKLSTYLTFS